jgi:hypothetical protein
MPQPRFLTCSQAQRAPRAHMPTGAALPATITPRIHVRRHTRCDKPHPPQRHVSVTARVTQNSVRLQTTQRTSHTRTQHTPAQRPAQPHTLLTAQTSPHAHRRAHATHSTAHSSDHPTRRPQKITPSHTRSLRAILTIVESGCPASTGCCRTVGCCTTATACRAHEQPSRHTTAPDAAADPSEPPAIAAQRIASIKSQIKSNESQSAHCMLSLNNNTVCE